MDIDLQELEFATDYPGGNRRIWMQPARNTVTRCCIFLDGELYRERVNAADVIARLRRQGELLDMSCVYFAAIDGAARHRDYACNDRFAQLLVRELLPWIEQTLGPQRAFYLCGLSLSGLAAAFALWKYPHVFESGLFQSPSAWWNNEWLASAIALEPTPLGRCWISVGTRELDVDVHHAPTGMHQRTSQLESVRRLADSLRKNRSVVQLHEFDGGHDPMCWRAELPDALRWLLS